MTAHHFKVIKIQAAAVAPGQPLTYTHAVRSMDTQSYPGIGLSLSQLVFALNKELKRVAYSPS